MRYSRWPHWSTKEKSKKPKNIIKKKIHILAITTSKQNRQTRLAAQRGRNVVGQSLNIYIRVKIYNIFVAVNFGVRTNYAV